MLRFHPYPRETSTLWDASEALNGLDVEEDVSRTSQGGPGQAGDQADNLVRAIHPRTQEVGDAKTGRFRRNSITSLVIDLALVVTRKSS